jgi:hypothetical protein
MTALNLDDKRCCKCKAVLPRTKFSKNVRASDGLQTVCKTCQKIQYEAFIQSKQAGGVCRCGKPPRAGLKSCKECATTQLDRSLRSKYGLSLSQRDGLAEAQDWRCGICQKPFTENITYGSFAVDHDHVTDKVRGLLCLHCNTGLGNFGESVETLNRAINYLEKSI